VTCESRQIDSTVLRTRRRPFNCMPSRNSVTLELERYPVNIGNRSWNDNSRSAVFAPVTRHLRYGRHSTDGDGVPSVEAGAISRASGKPASVRSSDISLTHHCVSPAGPPTHQPARYRIVGGCRWSGIDSGGTPCRSRIRL